MKIHQDKQVGRHYGDGFSLNELNNYDNMEDGKASNVLLRHHITSSEEFMNF